MSAEYGGCLNNKLNLNIEVKENGSNKSRYY